MPSGNTTKRAAKRKAEGLICPNCGGRFLDVVDSRSRADGLAVRRRRNCQDCGQRITTYEGISMPTGDQLKLALQLSDELRAVRKQINASLKLLDDTIAKIKEQAAAAAE
jgi:predicted Zn finger-like uncharacterized protein